MEETIELACRQWLVRAPPQEEMSLLAMARSLKVRAMLSLAYDCGLRAGEVVRLRTGDIDSAQRIISVVQSKGRRDRHVMLPDDVLAHAAMIARDRDLV